MYIVTSIIFFFQKSSNMKWRDRISILSRKRNCGSSRLPVSRQNILSSGPGTTSTHNPSQTDDLSETVENTLSQIRPVIGPDHKSYYILLRGNEDSFMCIQPAKDIVSTLDEVAKNVASGVKMVKTVPVPQAKKQKNTRARNYPKALTRKEINSPKRNGIQKSEPVWLMEERKVGASVSMGNPFLSKPEDAISGSISVVDDLMLSRTVQNVSCETNSQVVRTRTFLYPIVQNRLEPDSLEDLNVKQASCLVLPSDYERVSPCQSLIVPATETDLIESIVKSDSPGVEKREHRNSQNKTLHVIQSLLQPHAFLSEVDVKTGGSILDSVVKTEDSALDNVVTPKESTVDDAVNTEESVLTDQEEDGPTTTTAEVSSPVELSLIAKEGTVLNEHEITSQIKNLIESEQLVVGENSQIVVIR